MPFPPAAFAVAILTVRGPETLRSSNRSLTPLRLVKATAVGIEECSVASTRYRDRP
jgi:hypothetical protein